MSKEVAVVVGVGSGLGAALARRFARADCSVILAARDADRLKAIADETGPNVRAHPCDAADEGQVDALFARVARDHGAPDVVVFNVGAFARKSVLETTREDFESAWRAGCLAGFFVGRAAARAMTARGRGTILFTGATASLRGAALFQSFAAGKFGLRALAQSMARELQPKGIHVAHVVIDGPIDSARARAMMGDRGPEGYLSPDAIADTYFELHRQPRSAWTHELELRSWVEKF